MGRVVHLCTIDEARVEYHVDSRSGQYYAIALDRYGKFVLWAAGLSSSSIGYWLYLMNPGFVPAQQRWYSSVATGQINAWVFVGAIVCAVLLSGVLAWGISLWVRKLRVPVAVETVLEVQIIRQAHKKVLQALWSGSILLCLGLASLLWFYWEAYLPAAILAMLFLFLVFFMFFSGFVARFGFVCRRWRELEREGLV